MNRGMLLRESNDNRNPWRTSYATNQVRREGAAVFPGSPVQDVALQ